jgi:hypothetical protein
MKIEQSIILSQTLNENIIYIYNTEHLFCDEKMRLVDVKTYLHDHLKNFGFVDEVTVVAAGINGDAASALERGR